MSTRLMEECDRITVLVAERRAGSDRTHLPENQPGARRVDDRRVT
jgi:hypothetical protein